MFGAFFIGGIFMTGIGTCCPGQYDDSDLKSKEIAKEAAVQGAAGAKAAATYAYDNRSLLDNIETTDNNTQ